VIEVKTALTDNGFFEIRVSDNGTGIPESHLPFIFDRFYRVEINDERVSTGSGLGLALTKELVKLLDGTIAVESLFGEGTEFTVTLPVTESAGLQEGPGLHEIKRKIAGYILHPVRREQRSQPASHDHHEKPMLLIVEDNDDVIMYLMTFLGKDYDVIVVVNGEEGMTKAPEQVPDIILCDIMGC
ncbi:MAG: hybrid sensor histidine kinase/response regulator, partial [Bacteroidales bacterium]|nr:hybrid sensor histidine kinase/response regulator [Bacteroidales bacterium]